MTPAISVRFINPREIRMGSPFNVCSLDLQGDWVPTLPEYDWQDLSAHSPDGTTLVLVRWSTAGNVPGFCLYTINSATKSVEVGNRISGCCSQLVWGSSGVEYEVFTG